jgi:hypothetical protein
MPLAFYVLYFDVEVVVGNCLAKVVHRDVSKAGTTRYLKQLGDHLNLPLTRGPKLVSVQNRNPFSTAGAELRLISMAQSSPPGRVRTRSISAPVRSSISLTVIPPRALSSFRICRESANRDARNRCVYFYYFRNLPICAIRPSFGPVQHFS